jgi:hypothetical protein
MAGKKSPAASEHGGAMAGARNTLLLASFKK